MPSGVYKRKKGKENPAWKGGRRLSNGYWKVHSPGHPRASYSYVFEHILIAEQMLGRPLLKDEEIHHMGRRDDNTRIKVCKNSAEHKRLHVRLRAVRAGALPSWRKCKYCKKYDKPENLYTNGSSAHHSACQNEHRREHRKKNNNLKKENNYGKTNERNN